MASKKTFDEGAFRASLDDSLREVTVSDELRAKTLEKCRSWLESTNGKSTDGKRLTFVRRHAARFRIAAGLAACLLVVVLAGQLLPKLGYGSASPAAVRAASMEAAAEPSGAGISSGISAKSADMPAVAFSESAAADTAGQSAFADGAAVNETAVNEAAMNEEASENNAAMLRKDDTIRSGETSPAASASSEAGNTQEATATMAASVPEENPAGSTAFLLGASKPFSSLIVDNLNSALPEKPARVLVESSTKSIFDTHPTAVPDYTRMFAAYQMPVSITQKELQSSESIRDLLVPVASPADAPVGSTDESAIFASGNTGYLGLWRLPVKTENGWMLVPILLNRDVVGAELLLVGESADIRNEDGWLETLTDQDKLKSLLDGASSYPVVDWVVLDAAGGTGFLVGWQDGEKAMCMPFMDQPEIIGLKNGRAYDWNALKATVIPFL